MEAVVAAAVPLDACPGSGCHGGFRRGRRRRRGGSELPGPVAEARARPTAVFASDASAPSRQPWPDRSDLAGRSSNGRSGGGGGRPLPVPRWAREAKSRHAVLRGRAGGLCGSKRRRAGKWRSYGSARVAFPRPVTASSGGRWAEAAAAASAVFQCQRTLPMGTVCRAECGP